LEQGIYRYGIRHIGAGSKRFGLQAAGEVAAPVLVQIADNNMRPGFCKGFTVMFAYKTEGTGYDRYLILQRKMIHRCSLCIGLVLKLLVLLKTGCTGSPRRCAGKLPSFTADRRSVSASIYASERY